MSPLLEELLSAVPNSQVLTPEEKQTLSAALPTMSEEEMGKLKGELLQKTEALVKATEHELVETKKIVAKYKEFKNIVRKEEEDKEVSHDQAEAESLLKNL
ncbi:MAG: hypothetical protein AAB802_01895 [Patescibacteria group bacterium]